MRESTDDQSARPAERMTRQRKAVLTELGLDSAFRSTQQIHAALTEKGVDLGLATVYRNLQRLEETGRADSSLSAGGETLYRICQEQNHHHHLVCQNCGRAEEFTLDGVEDLIGNLALEHGYELTDHQIELYGLCKSCQDRLPAT